MLLWDFLVRDVRTASVHAPYLPGWAERVLLKLPLESLIFRGQHTTIFGGLFLPHFQRRVPTDCLVMLAGLPLVSIDYGPGLVPHAEARRSPTQWSAMGEEDGRDLFMVPERGSEATRARRRPRYLVPGIGAVVTVTNGAHAASLRARLVRSCGFSEGRLVPSCRRGGHADAGGALLFTPPHLG